MESCTQISIPCEHCLIKMNVKDYIQHECLGKLKKILKVREDQIDRLTKAHKDEIDRLTKAHKNEIDWLTIKLCNNEQKVVALSEELSIKNEYIQQ